MNTIVPCFAPCAKQGWPQSSNAPVKAVNDNERNDVFMGGSFDFASATNSRGDRIVQDSILGRNIFPSDPSSPLIHGHCSDNYRSIYYILPKGVDAEEIQPIADGGFEQGPDQCRDDVAFASE